MLVGPAVKVPQHLCSCVEAEWQQATRDQICISAVLAVAQVSVMARSALE